MNFPLNIEFIINNNPLIIILICVDIIIGLIGGIIVAKDWTDYGINVKKTLVPFCILFPTTIILILAVIIIDLILKFITFLKDLLT